MLEKKSVNQKNESAIKRRANVKKTSRSNHEGYKRLSTDDVKATLQLLQFKNPSGDHYFLEVMKKATSKPKRTLSLSIQKL
ncbi:hypothetical protein ACFOU2_15615 [Bacillus songklensis]|uniref:Uncharacterized protein n=1 Tax=Bacillus songklensis TaxID=1069116 RepID=A0ABV8B4I6_9BACI